ncbi:MAG: glycoside hydrolase family 16 protein [Akkermansiaceae bacterium]
MPLRPTTSMTRRLAMGLGVILLGLEHANSDTNDPLTITPEPAGLLRFKTEQGRFYQLEQKTADASDWSPLGDPIKGTGQTVDYFLKDIRPANRVLYRVRVLKRQWVMVWRDEFNGDRLDPSKWVREENGYGGGNFERQFYSTDTKYCHTSDGTLKISVYRDPHTTVDGKTQPYCSARIRTLHRAQWKYGRFEIRAKMPDGQGMWPAVWLLPSKSPYGTWASSGEIDIIESRGSEVHKTTGALHFGGAWPRNTYLAGAYTFPGKNAAQDFHTYVLEWDKDKISWSVDGVTYKTIGKAQWYSEKARDNPHAPFDQPFYLIVNVAVDGRFFQGTAQISDLLADKEFPQTLLVDYIRVYQWADPYP